MNNTDFDFVFNWDDAQGPLEKTPKYGEPKEEQYPEVAPGWYANCYLCSRSFEEKYMVRQEYRHKETVGKGWQAVTNIIRYVISYCVWCHHSYLKP